MKVIQRSPEPFYYSGGKTGILIIHGFTGTPSELRPMGEYFRDKGYTVYAPLLAGHGTSPEEMEKTGWRDWWQSTLDAYDRLRTENNLDHLFVAGLSMGGVLSLLLAAKKPVTGVISMCAPVWVRDRRAFLAGIAYPFYRYKLNHKHRDPDIEAHLVHYDRTPVKSVGELNRLLQRLKRCLPWVVVPALVIQSRNDETIQPRSASHIYEKISSKVKYLSWYEKSSHIITVDKERRKLFSEVDQFIRQVSSSSTNGEK
ncbi:alpha/beta hydrolase [Thermoactinomyces mirandus]|uniref:Alpha/beta fold hydrolase n=1 Tax=Thermoactinomyces mirandus TaxID=2756294 RepID=A0A7W1XUR9_9BACL|nr:alpha/beta fold hydrolase [Thermoactinomyces mirandus]MBA4603659.1 alpha/beta fold hydrolase [Thermoactinomyces mirandus]